MVNAFRAEYSPNVDLGASNRPRQDPVSCEACRKRKQKCSREQPCSNCASRGVSCVFVGGKVSQAGQNIVPAAATTPRAAGSNDVSSLRAENAAIKARLGTLEELVFGSDVHQADAGATERPTKVRRVAQSDGTIPTPNSTASNQSGQEQVKRYQNDLEWLDGVGSRENTRLPQLSTDFYARTGSVDRILDRISRDPQERCILLPTESVGLHLFTCYVDQVDPMQHMIHVPTVRRSIVKLYAKLQAGQRIEANETVLLLSILASIASYWSPADSESPEGVFASAQAASRISNYWLRTTLDVLEHVKRVAASSLETVQAGAIMIFLIYHMEGFSPKVRAILAAALSTAKDLALHKTDSPRNALTNPSKEDLVHVEIRRRVWWHLCGTDWSLAVAGGPHEGSYTVNPRHMTVRRPRNVSDEELENMPEDFEHHISEPTIMAYYLQRIRLSEISRHITDLTCEAEPDEVSVDDVFSVDARFRSALEELPSFLKVDEESRKQNYGLAQTYCQIILQRYTVNLALHARRCKFHLPLLLRASYEPRYSFSRRACLESARAVMQLKLDLTEEHGSLWISSSKLGGFLHLFFYATVVLVMDLCVNKAAGEFDSRKEEIREALQTLEQAKQQSVAASMFLDSLLAALRKHSIRLQSQNQEDGNQNGVVDDSANAGSVLLPTNGSHGRLSTTMEDPNWDEIDFDALWQSYIESGLDADPHSWDPLISDLEACVQGIAEE